MSVSSAASAERLATAPPHRGEAGRGWRRLAQLAVVALWAGALSLIGVTVVWGRRLQREAPEIFLGAAPLVGRNFRDGWDWRFGPAIVVAAVLAGLVVVAVGRGWLDRWRSSTVVGAAALAATAFAVTLAALDGSGGLRHGAEHESEYWAGLASFPPAGEFVRSFVERIDGYSVHVRGHPPGFVVLLMALDRIGLGSLWVAVGVSVVSVAAVVAAVLVVVRLAAGDSAMRAAAPFLVVAPYALWMVTSADAVFAGLGAVVVALLVAAGRSDGRSAVAAAIAGGLAYGVLLHMTYGAATFLLVPLLVGAPIVWRRPTGRGAIVASAVAGTAIVVAVFVAAGFWWLDGARATQREYWEGSAQFRTWTYFGLSNLAVALIALGPATLAGLTRLRDRRAWWIVGGGVAALLASHVSQYNRAEVERIWLLFYPWIAVAAVALAARRRAAATWVAVQAGSAIVLQAALVSKW